MARISESASRAQLRHHARQEVDTRHHLLINARPNASNGAVPTTEARNRPRPDNTILEFSAKLNANNFSGLADLAETTGKRFQAGIVLYRSSTTIPFGNNLWAVPLTALFSNTKPR
jgi:hypothetical protein